MCLAFLHSTSERMDALAPVQLSAQLPVEGMKLAGTLTIRALSHTAGQLRPHLNRSCTPPL